MAERGQRLQPTTLAMRLRQEYGNCGRYLQNLPSKCFTKQKNLKFPGSLNSQCWVFVKEELGDFRKGCPAHQHPKDDSLPHIHHRLPQATPKERRNGLPKGTAQLFKLSQAKKAFLEDVEDSMAPHPLAFYPHLEALPAELLMQVLEVLNPERNLEDTWAYCQDTRKLKKGPTKLVEKCSSQVSLPKKMPVSHSGQWLCKEKPSQANLLSKDSVLHDNVRREVRDFCDWVEARGSSPIDEELILQQFDMAYQTRRSGDACHATRRKQVAELKKRSGLSQLQEAELCRKPDSEKQLQRTQDKALMDGQPSLREHSGCWNEPQSSGRANPHKPKRVKMRYGAWYLKTSLWKKQRVGEPLVDPKISHKAPDATFKKHLLEQVELLAGLHGTRAFKEFILSRGYRMPRFLEKIHAEEKGKSEHIKTPKKLTSTERNPGRR